MVMAHDVFEDSDESSGILLERAVESVCDRSTCFLTVPNAVNIRGRIAITRGRTNSPPFDKYYQEAGLRRGHVGEYTRGDLERDCAQPAVGRFGASSVPPHAVEATDTVNLPLQSPHTGFARLARQLAVGRARPRNGE
jgi:hypothetical protein